MSIESLLSSSAPKKRIEGALSQPYQAFMCPTTYSSLIPQEDGLVNGQGLLFPYVGHHKRIVDFIAPSVQTSEDSENLAMYNAPHSTEIYRNFLDWLFATFNETEEHFRRSLISHLRLSPRDKVLITGCGLGDDLALIAQAVGPEGEIHAQDISKAMVLEAEQKNKQDNVLFSISNGNQLPYVNQYFDAVFHFGGINLFGDTRKAIAELARVCKTGGRVVFGDESVAPHLRGSEYANIAINNNRLWAAETPLPLLPHNALDIQLNYILGNCFYVIGFTTGAGFPYMNIDVEHKGIRGGCARTRYFGQLEGVSEASKKKIYDIARERNISVHALLEQIIKETL